MLLVYGDFRSEIFRVESVLGNLSWMVTSYHHRIPDKFTAKKIPDLIRRLCPKVPLEETGSSKQTTATKNFKLYQEPLGKRGPYWLDRAVSPPYHLMEKHCVGSGPRALLQSAGFHLASLSTLLHRLLCIQLLL